MGRKGIKIPNETKLNYAKLCFENKMSKREAARQLGVNNATEFKRYDENKGKHKAYLSVILDLYDRRIVSYVIRDSHDNSLVFDTFHRAIAANPGAAPLCHRDRGFQYTNSVFHSKLESAGMTPSMLRAAKCIDNGLMEGVWGILKRERYYGKRFQSRWGLAAMIESDIYYYNNERYQRRFGVLTPMEKHESYILAV